MTFTDDTLFDGRLVCRRLHLNFELVVVRERVGDERGDIPRVSLFTVRRKILELNRRSVRRLLGRHDIPHDFVPPFFSTV